MHTLKISEAAALLCVSPNTLRAWERRFGYPRPRRSAGHQRVYVRAEIEGLRAALEDGLSVSSAISAASDALDGTYGLAAALHSFSASRADRAMETSLGIRSVDDAVECVLLPTLDTTAERYGASSAEWAFGVRWARSWLTRAGHMAAIEGGWPRLIIADATETELDPASPHVAALEFLCRRAGASVVCLSVRAADHVGDLVSSLSPDAVVLAGAGRPNDEVARWWYAVTASAGQVPLGLFRSFESNGGPGTSLTGRATRAREQVMVLARMANGRRGPVARGNGQVGDDRRIGGPPPRVNGRVSSPSTA
ncbi:MAG: MerR family transcriptional regulator, light-induced transcriptional regulator [Thermoleophilaceae bacterium]|nr:MerR family transcriptional regulator, light-induced transcriptional regulator [Thermoleophilaceae bacterium]